MLFISYSSMVFFITAGWCLARGLRFLQRRSATLKRELQLLLVYICIVVVARFTFFPFSKVNGQIQPLIFDPSLALSFRINWIPLVNLLDYPALGDILINVIGNTAMFIPLGIVWPCVYPQLDTPAKTIGAGVGFSLLIELMQLPFYDRVSDIDDLILNSFGFLIGYSILLLIRKLSRRPH